jgi:hypothetical protein
VPPSHFVPPPQDDDEEEAWAAVWEPPRPLLVINDKGGKRCRFKAQHLPCLTKPGGTGFQISVAPVSVCWLSQCSASVKQTWWHRFWLLDATGPCNKFSLASIELENLCYVCLDVCWTFLCILRLICYGTEFGNSVAPGLTRQHYLFFALFVEVLI